MNKTTNIKLILNNIAEELEKSQTENKAIRSDIHISLEHEEQLTRTQSGRDIFSKEGVFQIIYVGDKRGQKDYELTAHYVLASHVEEKEIATLYERGILKVVHSPVIEVYQVYNESTKEYLEVTSFFDNEIHFISKLPVVKDHRISVKYEWGENAIDWVNGIIKDHVPSVGDKYWVKYLYGARSKALVNNYGTLLNFSRGNIEREDYRRALKALVESYVTGPVTQSIKNIIRAFTFKEPEIVGLSDESWMLDHNYLSKSPPMLWKKTDVVYFGQETFSNVYFNEPMQAEWIKEEDGLFHETPEGSTGLLLTPNYFFTFDPTSVIAINTGSIEIKITPNWDGNDGFDRYIFDTGIENSSNRLSLYKTGGNMVFELIDDEGAVHVVTTDVSKWKRGEYHYIGVTWRLNSKNDFITIYADGQGNTIPFGIQKFGTFNFGDSIKIVEPAKYGETKYAEGKYVTESQEKTIAVSFLGNKMFWGCSYDLRNALDATITELLITKRLLSQEEANQHYKRKYPYKGEPGTFSSITFLTHFNHTLKSIELSKSLREPFLFVEGINGEQEGAVDLSTQNYSLPFKNVISQNEGTIDFWIMFLMDFNNHEVVFFDIYDNHTGCSISLYKSSDNLLTFDIHTADKKSKSISTFIDDWKNIKQWHHIACVWKANSENGFLRLIIDGAPRGIITFGEDFTFSTFKFGQDLSTLQYTFPSKYGFSIYGNFVYGKSDRKLFLGLDIYYPLSFVDPIMVLGGNRNSSIFSKCAFDNFRISDVARPISELSQIYSTKKTPVDFHSLVNLSFNGTLKTDLEPQQNKNIICITGKKSKKTSFKIYVKNPYKIKLNRDLINYLINKVVPAHFNAFLVYDEDV